MGDAVRAEDEFPYGTSSLPRDLTAEEMAAVPVVESIDVFVIEGLTEEEDELFAAALAP